MDSSRISQITPSGISYTDDDNHEKWIDFALCLETYLRWSTNNMTTPKQLEDIRKSKQVGEMHVLGDYTTSDLASPYVEFYDKLGTRFEFTSQEACLEFGEKIASVGWYLFDVDD